ncbi:btaf1 RNA polymerase II, B-TFIID transcription factor-associated, 170kDa [Trebouxia sp. C0009 RCD-2024]
MSSSEGSRLGKLLALLETGGSLDIRRAAAEQVASIAQTHPAQLPSLLRHIRSCLRHTQWDTRVAASTCLGLMAAHFTHHSVITLADAAGPATGSPVKTEALDGASAMPFQDFNITQVLQQGTVLVASGGQEYETLPEEGTRAEQLAKQQKNLKQRSVLLTELPLCSHPMQKC